MKFIYLSLLTGTILANHLPKNLTLKQYRDLNLKDKISYLSKIKNLDYVSDQIKDEFSNILREDLKSEAKSQYLSAMKEKGKSETGTDSKAKPVAEINTKPEQKVGELVSKYYPGKTLRFHQQPLLEKVKELEKIVEDERAPSDKFVSQMRLREGDKNEEILDILQAANGQRKNINDNDENDVLDIPLNINRVGTTAPTLAPELQMESEDQIQDIIISNQEIFTQELENISSQQENLNKDVQDIKILLPGLLNGKGIARVLEIEREIYEINQGVDVKLESLGLCV